MANPNDSVEGEGSRSADQHYRDEVKKFMEEDDPEQRAREAQRDIERDPDAYRDAEEAGKRRIAEEDREIER